MIIQCPNCSTGFNLPDKHITAKGAKLRCSRCSYVFRVRREDPEQDIEFFYKPEDEKANAELAAAEASGESSSMGEGGGLGEEDSLAIELGADFEALLNSAPASQDRAEEPAPVSEPASSLSEPDSEPEEFTSSKTQVGLPGAGSPDLSGYGFGSSKSSSSSEDPFPLAGGSLKNLKNKIKIEVPRPGAPKPSLGGLSGSSVTAEPEAPAPQEPVSQDESPTAGIDLFGDELEPAEQAGADPFAGAFQEEDSLDPESFAEENAQPVTQEAAAQEDLILQPGQPGMQQAFSAPQPQVASALATPDPVVAPTSAPVMLQGNSGGAFVDAGDLVDPSFGSQGASFDPQQGVVSTPAAAPAPAAAPQQPRPATQQATAAQPATSQPLAAATSTKKAAAATNNFEDSWPTQADAIAAHRIGGGGAQKVANFVLIALLVLVAFLGLVAALNDGMLDFKQFGSMIEVAFSDGEYKPRKEWIPAVKVEPKVAMEAPLRTESVWAEVVPYGKKKRKQAQPQVLVVRGLLRNFDKQDFSEVTLRGVVLDGKERIQTEKVVPVGTLVSNAQIAEIMEEDALSELVPDSSQTIRVGNSEPFTILFDEIPENVSQGAPIFFRVDVASKKGSAAPEAP